MGQAIHETKQYISLYYAKLNQSELRRKGNLHPKKYDLPLLLTQPNLQIYRYSAGFSIKLQQQTTSLIGLFNSSQYYWERSTPVEAHLCRSTKTQTDNSKEAICTESKTIIIQIQTGWLCSYYTFKTLISKRLSRKMDRRSLYCSRDRLRRENIPIYKLKDWNGEEIKELFYNVELLKVNKDRDNLWHIEKVLKKRKRHGKTELYE